MKIIYLDEPTYLPDYVVEQFSRLGDFVVYRDKPSREEAVRRLNDADIAILEWTAIDREMFEEITRVRYIVVALTGYSFVDVIAAREKGILVSNIPQYSRQSVAEHAFALLLAVERKLLLSNRAVKEGKHYYFKPFMGRELYGKTLGILGLGSIGSWVAQIGLGFGMNVLATSRSPKNMPGVQDVDLETLLRSSDALIVCVDHNPSTDNLINRETLSLMKKTATLVSIVPGVCDEDALAYMLKQHLIAGVGLDTPKPDSPLREMESAVLTSHIAWYTQDSLDRLASIMVDNVLSYVNGTPINVVNR